MTVVLLPGSPVAGSRSPCGCCGRWLLERSVRMMLFDGSAFYGEICPECILLGPKGAARRTESLLAREAGDPAAGTARGSRRRASGAWARFMRRKAAALAAMPSFPPVAKQAALRELRKKR